VGVGTADRPHDQKVRRAGAGQQTGEAVNSKHGNYIRRTYMIITSLIIAIASVSAALYAVHYAEWAAEEPCNGEIEMLEKIDRFFRV